MTESGSTLCHTCGEPVGSPARLNRLPSGQLCPTCHERVLEGLPALLPGGAGGASRSEGPAPEPRPAPRAELRLLSGSGESSGDAPTAG